MPPAERTGMVSTAHADVATAAMFFNLTPCSDLIARSLTSVGCLDSLKRALLGHSALLDSASQG